MKTNLNEIAKTFHQSAVNKGFWDKEREKGTILMLVVSELAEALEADRKSKYSNIPCFEAVEDRWDRPACDAFSFESNVKDTFEDEIADTFIRLFDLVGAYNIDIDKHIELKMKYNQTREKMHGKKY